MKKVFLFILPFFIAFLVFGIFVFFLNKNNNKGALQVTSGLVVSNVYINGKLMGQTPFCKCPPKDMLPVGEYTIRLVPQVQGFTPFEEKVTVSNAVLTAVDRTFGAAGTSEGVVISLLPLSNKAGVELLVVSLPDKADVYVDKNKKGATPLLLKDITDSDHEIRLAKDGYAEKSVRIKTVRGYKLSATVYLGVNMIPTSSLSAPLASPSAILTKVTILTTPTGFLRVRKEPSADATQIAQVKPGEEYEVLEEKEGWYLIKLTDGSGWISSEYATKK